MESPVKPAAGLRQRGGTHDASPDIPGGDIGAVKIFAPLHFYVAHPVHVRGSPVEAQYANLKAEMRIVSTLRISACVAAVFTASLQLCAQGQPAPPKAEGLPPRATPADYQFQAQAGTLTIAAEFTGHSVATPEATLTTEDYVAIEVAVYGPPGARTKLSPDDFTLRVSGKKKAPLARQPYGLVVKTLKDPELEPTAAETKSKTSVNTGGQSDAGSAPAPYRVPDELRHTWSQRLQKEDLPEGDRALPVAGLIFFAYHGKTEKIESLELIYAGPAGTATLRLQP